MSNDNFTRDMFADPDDDAGIFMSQLGEALVTWTAMNMEADNGRQMTVEDAAKAFNTSPEVIVEAIADAMWIGVHKDGKTIYLDGE